MRRRDFISIVGSAAAWPLTTRAQQLNPVRRIGVVMNLSENDPDARRRIEAFRNALNEFGWTDGRNATIDLHFAAGDASQIRSAISEMIGLQPEVILATATNVLSLLRPVAPGTPIVFVLVSDPVGQGFVDSLAHPGGRITGFTSFEFSMSGKWLETLKELVPHITRIALIFNPDTAPYGEKYLGPLQSAAQLLRVEPLAFRVHTLEEVEKSLTSFARFEGSNGLIVIPDAFTVAHRAAVITLAAANRLPSIYSFRFFATEGGLISYGIDNIDLYQRAASYVDKILRGANPAELPIQEPTKFELVVNLKTAKTLGLTVSQSLIARADEVIE
jgi:putative tryptophan/tyrosine transport system substrate-binding protein